MTPPKAIMLTGALGAALVIGTVADSPSAGLPVQLGSALPSQAASEQASPVARCGGAANTDNIALQHPLPNAYMTVNGRMFSLADLIRCTARLHTARLS